MRYFPAITFLIMISTARMTAAQSVVFTPQGQLLPGTTINVAVAAPIDTGKKNKSETMTAVIFANDSYKIVPMQLQLKKDLTGYKDSLIINGLQINAGLHSFFINFPSAYTRGYNCFTSGFSTSNLTERVVYAITNTEYQQFFTDLSNTVVNGDSTKVFSTLPNGFQGVICFDFVANTELGVKTDGYQAMITKCQFFNPGNVTAFDGLFKLIAGKAQTTAAYLSTEWQAGPDQYHGTIKQLSKDLFTDPGAYISVTNKKDKSSRLIFAYHDDGAKYHRLIIFINQPGL